jgi:DNA-binding SARP family transcriptional activator
MWFGILGPLLVRDGDEAVAVSAARQRVLLAALLVHAGKAVPAGALAELVWDGAPPAGAAVTLRSHVLRLRRTLGPRAGQRVLTQCPGYLIQAREDEVDLLEFASWCRAGGDALRVSDWSLASEKLGKALSLWRGAVLADVRCGLLQRDELPGLERLRLQALEWRIEARLQLGRHGELVPELEQLAAGHPLLERFHAQLMLALYRCGRRAEALAAYQRARDVLAEELGVEPGTELRELHQRMLTGDPVLAVPAVPVPASALAAPALATTAAAGSRRVVPRQLPASVPYFVGRVGELEALTSLRDSGCGGPPGAVVISAIGGTAGVGKTALAVYWAHQVAGRFPDGQLYVNLRGYDPGQPLPVADVLAGFLRALGVPAGDIPAEAEERAARYRSLLAGRRMLVVLDNAGSVEQVRPLLPGAPACVAVVTSRDSLAGLVARDGAARLDLDLLPLPEAVGLLRLLIGPPAVADPAAAAALAVQCSRLPLALRVAAELAAARPAIPLAELVCELADQQRRLDLLNVSGDPRSAVRAVFSWSYRHLGAPAARMFRLAGLPSGPGLDRYATAALAGLSVEQARQLLDLLARAHLVQLAGPGRYGMHDLLRAYVRELAAAQDSDEDRRAALTRLFDYYLYAAATAIDTLFPAEAGRRPQIPPSGSATPPVTEEASARSWLDAERPSLVAAAAQMAENGCPGHAIRLATTLFRYLDVGGHYADAVAIHGIARAAAAQTGDRAAEAYALTSLGAADLRQGRYRQAGAYFQQALSLYRGASDRAGESRVLGNLASFALRQGDYPRAVGYIRRALALFREFGDRAGEGRALAQLGDIAMQQGRYRQAASHLRQALGQLREIGDRPGEAHVLADLGGVNLRQDRYREAAAHVDQALVLYRETGDRTGEAEALNSLGEVLLAAGDPGRARSQHATALGLAGQIGDEYEQARAHDGLARAHQASGNPAQAWRHWQQALARYSDLGVPEADRVRAQLTAARDGPGLGR